MLRLGRDFIWRSFGLTGVLIGIAVFLGLTIGWRLFIRQRARRQGVVEHTPQMVRHQLENSGVAPPAFAEDGSLLGASVLVVNQRSKLIEVQTEYEVFDSEGHTLGHVRQIGQGRAKQVVRFIASFDQFFTHHFDISDRSGAVVLRITRPAKVFKSRIEVFDGADQFVGRIVQQNVFGKINFAMYSSSGDLLASLKAENWRGMGLPRRAAERHRDRPSDQDVGGIRAHLPDQCRSLRGACAPGAGRPPAITGVRRRPDGGRCAEAGSSWSGRRLRPTSRHQLRMCLLSVWPPA